MILRPRLLDVIKTGLRRNPVVALLGPRQCGKTTLAGQVAKTRKSVWFDLEKPTDRQRLEDPMTTLSSLKGLIVIDEVQFNPSLFPVLRVLADRSPTPARFLLLGSASPDLVRHTSETLAGRVEFANMGGFDLCETGSENANKLWIRGGFPRAYLARSNQDSFAWRENFVRTFLERDLPNLGITIPPATLRRFWTMLAHYHGQIWNASQLGRNFGISDKSVRSYLDLLSGTFLVRQLQPWYENVKKRQVKSPKIYLRDTGMLHCLLGLGDQRQVLAHPKCGASWEGFALEQVLSVVGSDNAYFWATHSGAELDLLVLKGAKKVGFEFKFGDAPKVTKSMRTALTDLNLHQLHIVHPGADSYTLEKRIGILSIQDILHSKRIA